MIDWLQQHWPWVVLVAVAPILWGLVPVVLQLAWEIICLPFVTLAALNRWLIRVSTPPRPIPVIDEKQIQEELASWRASEYGAPRPDETPAEFDARVARVEQIMRESAIKEALEAREQIN